VFAPYAVPDALRLSAGVGEGADHFNRSSRTQAE
jgi:hypothetical protein